MGEVFNHYIDTAGVEHWYDTETGAHTSRKEASKKYNPPKMYGWICPVCGRGLSPYTTSCPCTQKWEITC